LQLIPPNQLRAWSSSLGGLFGDYFPNTSCAAIVRVYDKAGNVIETHEHKGEVKD
jgi:hypothetical protein